MDIINKESFAYVTSSIAVIIFLISYIPDTIKAIRTKQIKGVTILTPSIQQIGALCALYADAYFGNYPFVFLSVVSIIFNFVIIYYRFTKR